MITHQQLLAAKPGDRMYFIHTEEMTLVTFEFVEIQGKTVKAKMSESLNPAEKWVLGARGDLHMHWSVKDAWQDTRDRLDVELENMDVRQKEIVLEYEIIDKSIEDNK